MPITFDSSSTPCVISLSGEINIRCSVKLKEVLVEALSLERELHIDLTGVTEMDTAALQLLWVAEREARNTARELKFDRVLPDVVVAALDHAGLKFSLPMPILVGAG